MENEKLEDIKNTDGGVKRGVKGQWVFFQTRSNQASHLSLPTLLQMLNIRHVYLLKGQARQKDGKAFENRQ